MVSKVLDSHFCSNDYDPNLALALVWGETMAEAKKRGREFLKNVVIEGENSVGDPIMTNLPYLNDNFDRLLTF